MMGGSSMYGPKLDFIGSAAGCKFSTDRDTGIASLIPDASLASLIPRGAWEEGSIAPVPSSPARVLGDHPRRMLHWSSPYLLLA